MTLAWTQEHRWRVHGPRHRLPDDPVADTADAAWAKLLGIYAGRTQVEWIDDERRVHQVRLFTSKNEALAAHIRGALQELGGAPRPTRLDHDREALRAHMIHAYIGYQKELIRDLWPSWEWARNLVDFWAGTAGLGFVIEVLLRPTKFFFETPEAAPRDVSLSELVPADREYYFLRNETAYLHAIRAWLSSQTNEEYARHRDAADRAIDVLDMNDRPQLQLRCRFAWALSPRDTSMTEALAVKVLEPKVEGDDRWLYSALPTAAAVMEFMDRRFKNPNVPAAHELVFDIVDAYQEEAGPILERLVKWSTGLHKPWLRDAIKLVKAASKPAKKPVAKKTAPKVKKPPSKVKKPAASSSRSRSAAGSARTRSSAR